jgi:hypothetical protein
MAKNEYEFLPAVGLPENFLSSLMEGLNYQSFSIADLVKKVAEFRGRPIVLCPLPMPEQTDYGMWIAGPSFDFVFFEWETARVHQDHIILHELAHMLLGHRTANISVELEAELLEHKTFSVIYHTPDTAEVLMRNIAELHERLREREAEALATLIQNEIIRRVGIQNLTRRVTSLAVWTELAIGLGIDR